MPVVTSSSRLVGHSTLETSLLTSCMNFSGVIFDIRSNLALHSRGEIVERKSDCNRTAEGSMAFAFEIAEKPPKRMASVSQRIKGIAVAGVQAALGGRTLHCVRSPNG